MGTCADCVKTVTGVAKAVLHLDRTSDKDMLARNETCRVCPHVTGTIKTPGGLKLTVRSRCELCNCFIVLKTKVKSEQCPDTPPRWPAIK